MMGRMLNMPKKIERSENSIFRSETYRMNVPEGIMYVNLIEDNNRLACVDIQIGKAGSTLRAWNQVVGEFITALLDAGVSIHNIIEILSGHKSDRSVYLSNGRQVSSAAEGLYIILVQYNTEKTAALELSLRKSVGYFMNRRRA